MSIFSDFLPRKYSGLVSSGKGIGLLFKALGSTRPGRFSDALVPVPNRLVKYFMVTFTMPFQLRQLAKNHQTDFYSLMFRSATSTLKQFAKNGRELGCDIGMTGVLHTHSQQLNYHPHIHFIVPAGGLKKDRKEWKEWKEWIVDCEHVGQGLPALKYLSRYLYHGVISDRNIITDDGNNVTFQFTDSATGETKTRKRLGEILLLYYFNIHYPKVLGGQETLVFYMGMPKRHFD